MHRRAVVVLGQTPYKAFFQNVDPIGKSVRIGATLFTVVGVAAQQPSLGGLDTNQDSLALIPYTTFEKQFGVNANQERGWTSVLIFAAPREGVKREDAIEEIETIMRIRHGLKLNQENDFDISTQDMIMKSFEQVTQGVYLGLLAISSVALMVGGIGVMAVMMISVTERTREIGVRKALGARRREILYQFLDRGAGADLARRPPGSHRRQPDWPARPHADPVAGVDAVVVVRDRLRLLRRGRALLRPDARREGLAPRPHRGPPVRIGAPAESAGRGGQFARYASVRSATIGSTRAARRAGR